MKIVQILPSLYMGGGEKFAVDLCNELAKDRNNEVILCVLSKVNNSMQLLSTINSNVEFISFEKNVGFNYKILFKLYQFLKEKKPDVVHTHMRSLIYATYSIVRLKTPFIHTFHTLAHKEAATYLKQILFHMIFAFFNVRPVSITHSVLKSVQKTFGKRYNILINNGVSSLRKSDQFANVQLEIDSYKQDKDTKIFMNVARVTKVKNQLLLIETFKKLKKENVNAVLILIGSLSNEIEYAKKCQKTAKDSDNIYFLDEKNNVGDYIYCSDVICMSSLYEGLPLVILEAMSMGKPIISTPVGGIPDVIDSGINGFLSKDMSVEEYSHVIYKIMQKTFNNEKEIEMIFKEKYSMKICKNEYQKLYESVLNNK